MHWQDAMLLVTMNKIARFTHESVEVMVKMDEL